MNQIVYRKSKSADSDHFGVNQCFSTFVWGLLHFKHLNTLKCKFAQTPFFTQWMFFLLQPSFIYLTLCINLLRIKSKLECSVNPNWRCLSDSNNVIAGTKGQNKCVCLNILRLQFQSPPHERWNNGEGGKLKKRGLFQINKHGLILNGAATEQPDWFSEDREQWLCRLSSSSSSSSSSLLTPKQTDIANTNKPRNYNSALCSISLSHFSSPLCSPFSPAEQTVYGKADGGSELPFLCAVA